MPRTTTVACVETALIAGTSHFLDQPVGTGLVKNDVQLYVVVCSSMFLMIFFIFT